MVQMNAPKANLQYDAGGAGNSLARLGQQLAQTGQDVSNIMLETAETQDRVDLMRAEQKWKEIESKQMAFQDANKADPLSWDENRSKLMNEFHSYNNTVRKNTKRGKLNFTMASEGFAGNLENSTFRSMQKRINMNLVEEGGIAINQSLEAGFPETARAIADDISSHLTPAGRAAIDKRIADGEEKLNMDMKYDWIDANAKESKEALYNSTGIFASNDRDTKEKLIVYQSRMQQRGIGQQMDDYEVASSDPNYTRKDYLKDKEDGKFDQLEDGDLAKLTASWERSTPPTHAELLEINEQLAGLSQAKTKMSPDQYITHFNDTRTDILSKLAPQGNPEIRSMLQSLNPYAPKTGGGSRATRDLSLKRGVVTSELSRGYRNGLYNSDKITPVRRDSRGKKLSVQLPFDVSTLTEAEKAEAGRKQEDIKTYMDEWIDDNPEATNQEIRDEVKRQAGMSKLAPAHRKSVNDAYEARSKPAKTEKTWQGTSKKQSPVKAGTKDKSTSSNTNKAKVVDDNPLGNLGGELLKMESDEELAKLLEEGKAAQVALDIEDGKKSKTASN